MNDNRMPDVINKLNLVDEAELDSSISFSPDSIVSDPQSVFLTGVTGLVGPFLLAEILQKTSMTVYCLVRANDSSSAFQRLKKHLITMDLWEKGWESRIVSVAGDLTKTRFGLETEKFEQIARKVDLIYHCAAFVNFMRPYVAMKPCNVIGTHEIIRLAGACKTKPLHYVSSVAVFFEKGSNKNHFVESDLVAPETLTGGYRQSKWVAEKMVRNARELGLPANIYRTSRITGDSQHGRTSNLSDLLNSMLKACILLKKFPDSEIRIKMTPADFFSQNLFHLAQQKDCWNKEFHMISPHITSWNELMAMVQKLGYSMEKVSLADWWNTLEQARNGDDEWLGALTLPQKMANRFFTKKPTIDTKQTESFLADTEIRCPSDAILIEKYLSFFQKSGFLPTPSSKSFTGSKI